MSPATATAFRPGLGTAAVLVSGALVLVLARPALPVLALGLVVALATRTSPRSVNPPLLVGLVPLTLAASLLVTTHT